MAAERGPKFSDIFDGTSKTFEDFHFDFTNQMTYAAMAGKGVVDREASSAM